MTVAVYALVLAMQASNATQASPTHRDGMIYDEITDRYIPIIGWKPKPSGPQEVPKGTKLEYKRLNPKVGEAPVKR